MIKVLFEDEHILVCEKPAGIATQAGKVTEKDMVSEVNNYMRKAGAKASAYLIHRLDKPVRGILLFAKTNVAAAELNKQLTSGSFEKKYYAVVENCPDSKEETLENNIYKNGNKAFISDTGSNSKEIKPAKLQYSVICKNIRTDEILISDENISGSKYNDSALFQLIDMIDNNDPDNIGILDVKLYTGRFHQIRCQLSNINSPIVGDSLYGSTVQLKKRNTIGLIAYSLSFNHPVTKKRMTFTL